MSEHGAYRNDGSWIGYDYAAQAWIDTSPSAVRDESAPAGSARNPFSRRIAPCEEEARRLGLI